MELQGKIINILGDSITYGVGASDAEHSYPAVLQRLTGAAQVRNYGVSGTRIARQQKDDEDWDRKRAFVERYVHMEDEADLVIVFGGTNDYGHGDAPFGTLADRTPHTFCGACHTLFQGLLKKYPTARLAIMTPMQCGSCSARPAISGKFLKDYADALIQIAGEYSIPVLDLYRSLGITFEVPEQGERFCPDGLHPNDAGAERIARLLAEFLKTL